MRLMLYNIYKGGDGRLPLIESIVKKLHPDILGILEANDWQKDDYSILKRFASRCDFSYSFLGQANTKYNLAWFSRSEPVEILNISDGFWHSSILATVDWPSIGLTKIILLHLNPHTEEDRFQEIKKVIESIGESDKVIILGDLNSLSPHNRYGENLWRLMKKNNIKKFGSDKLEFKVIEMVEKYGLVDIQLAAGKQFTSTVPTPINRDYTHLGKLRLDYVFTSPLLVSKMINFEVVKCPLTDNASDHYPIIVDFKKDDAALKV